MTTQTIDREVLKERVLKGAALLDEVNPGWRERIDPDIRIYSSSKCILGQLYGEYGLGLEALEGYGVALAPEKFGFICDTKVECTCSELQPIWKEII